MSLSKEILNKQQGIKMFSQGMFGNKVKTYFTLEELFSDPNPPRFLGIRYQGLGGGRCEYDIPLGKVSDRWLTWVSEGMEENKMFLNDSDNYDSKLLIQGEVCESERGLELRYSTIKKKMRLALAEEEKYSYGLSTKFILKHFLDPASYDNLMEILDTYKDHVIEFSAWSVNVGNIPGRNTVIWEVRKY